MPEEKVPPTDEAKVKMLLVKKFEMIEEINRKKAEIAKIHTELARMGQLASIPAVSAW